MKNKFLFIFITIISVILFSCSKNDGVIKDPNGKSKQIEISDEGRFVKLINYSTDQILSELIIKKQISTDINAPCKIMISAVKSSDGKSYLFENSDLSEMYSNFNKTKVMIDKAKIQTERMKNLVANQVAAGKDLLESVTELTQLKTTLAAMESQIRVMGFDYEQINKLEAGKVIVIADISEVNIRLLKVGGFVDIVFNSYPSDTYHSKILSMGSVVDPLTRTIKVQIILENKDSRLLPGLYGQVILSINKEADATVAAKSVFTANGKTYIFVEKEPGLYERREVMTGIQGTDWIEIVKGINPGEKVVYKGVMLLKSLSFGY